MTASQLLSDLRRLGVCPGDALFVHSSFKSLGPVEGGAETVIAALEAAVGDRGVVLMPSFNLVAREERAATWNLATTPATTGWLCERFRTLPGTLRSDHYSHSVAARGWEAATWVAGHRERVGFPSPWDLEPWGKTYGARSPFVQCEERGAKVLMLGTGYDSVTFFHLAEVMRWARLRESDPAAPYPWICRPDEGVAWEKEGAVRKGTVGEAPSRLFGVRELIAFLVNRR